MYRTIKRILKMIWLHEHEIDRRNEDINKVYQQVTDKLIKELGIDSLENKKLLEGLRECDVWEYPYGLVFFNAKINNPYIPSYFSIFRAKELKTTICNRYGDIPKYEIIKKARKYRTEDEITDNEFEKFIKFINSDGEDSEFRTFIELVNGLVTRTLFSNSKPGVYIDVKIVCD